MRRLMASFWIPILAASVFVAACASPADTESAATTAEPAAPAAEGAAPVIPVPTDPVVETAIPGVVTAFKIQMLAQGSWGGRNRKGSYREDS